MIAWTIAQIMLLGGLLALAAWGAETALRAAGRPTRWAWVGALLTTLALALLTPLRTGSENATPIITATSAATTTATPVAAPSGLRVTLVEMWYRLTAAGERAVQDAWAIWHGAVPASTERVLLLAWIVASVVLLIAFVAVHQRFARRRAQWPMQTLLDTPVRVADNIGPAVIGVTRAEIVVPQWLLTRETREQQLVLAHEREHVRLHDPLLLAMAQTVIVLLPWHPAVWWMASRLRLAVELDCDRRVLQRGASARDYGTLLIDLTDHRAGFGAALPAFSCTPSHLERRLIAMTPKKVRYPLVRVLSATALASLALLAACEAKLPTDAEVESMTAKTAVTAVLGKSADASADIIYFVDSVRVTKEDANALRPDQIASVNVTQGKTPTSGAVYIVTSDRAARSVKATPSQVTYTINGAPATKADADKLSPDNIATVNVVKRGTAGEGEIQIVTKGATPDAATTPTVTNLRRSGAQDRSFSMPGAEVKSDGLKADISLNPNKFTGLVVVDGVLSSSSAMEALNPNDIAGVSVLKGPAATAKYSDPRAVNGVIEIVTKKAKP